MKKILALALALCMLFCFAGCAKQEEKLVMGTNAAFPPYEYVDDEGNIVGIDAEIAQAIADKLGLELEIKDMEFESLVTACAGGSIDVVLAGMTVTDERKEEVNFSDSYATGVQVVIVKNDSDIAPTKDDEGNDIVDLTGKTIGVQSGTTGDSYCTTDYGQENVKQYSNGALAVEALKNGQVDCVVIDNEPAKNYVAANEGLKILETEYIIEDYAIAIAKENKELLSNVNAALADLKAEGKIDQIINKYIPAE